MIMEDRILTVQSPQSCLDETCPQSSATGREGVKHALYVGQPQNLFCRGARFDGISRMKIHPPPPGCEPNEYQSMLSNDGEIFFTPAPKRQSGAKKSSNKVTPNLTVVANIRLSSQTNVNK